jgi:hypothetical protein
MNALLIELENENKVLRKKEEKERMEKEKVQKENVRYRKMLLDRGLSPDELDDK